MSLIEEDYKDGWRQHFPTYDFKHRDIALEEYRVAAKSLEAEERVFLNASNITLVSAAALGSLVIGSSGKLMSVFEGIIPSSVISLLLLSLVFGFSFISLKYFSDRQRAITFAGRKVIILRRMLGLSYGEVQLILPNWRVEGADQPLALRLFPGWLTYAAYPFWIVSIISCPVFFFTLAHSIKANPTFISSEYYLLFVALFTITLLLLQLYIYRTSLLDTHENTRLLIYKRLCEIINIPLATNTEYIIYRAKLASYETSRLKVNLVNLEKILIFVEDKDFYSHSGISYKSLARAALGLIHVKRRSGGSTIVQQLVRTLFIRDLSKTLRRKFVELGMAPWFNSTLTKKEILAIYLSSVRFERGKFGVVAAMNHYWGNLVQTPTKAQSFFLIERISNIQSRLLTNKIIETAKAAVQCGVLVECDLAELCGLYVDAVSKGKIKSCQEDLMKLSNVFIPELQSIS